MISRLQLFPTVLHAVRELCERARAVPTAGAVMLECPDSGHEGDPRILSGLEFWLKRYPDKQLIGLSLAHLAEPFIPYELTPVDGEMCVLETKGRVVSSRGESRWVWRALSESGNLKVEVQEKGARGFHKVVAMVAAPTKQVDRLLVQYARKFPDRPVQRTELRAEDRSVWLGAARRILQDFAELQEPRSLLQRVDGDLRGILDLVPGLGEQLGIDRPAPVAESRSSRGHKFDIAAKVLHGVAADEGRVLVIDNLENCDTATNVLLEQLARTEPKLNVILVVGSDQLPLVRRLERRLGIHTVVA